MQAVVSLLHMKRSKLLAPVAALILTVSAIAAVWLLVGRDDSSRDAQLQTSSLTLSLADLQSAPRLLLDRLSTANISRKSARICATRGTISGLARSVNER